MILFLFLDKDFDIISNRKVDNMKTKIKKRRIEQKKQQQVKYILIIIVLLLVAFYTTKQIISMEKYAKYNQINEKTSKYISFQYKDNDNIIYIENPKVLSDKVGKKQKKHYSYTIKNNSNKDLRYQIILTPINMDNLDNIKVYLTNSKDKSLTEAKLYNELFSVDNNKRLYTGIIKKNSVEKHKLRMWITENTKKNLAFKISIKLGDR